MSPYQHNTHSLKKDKLWKRAVILVDMNAFFASIEQVDFPELQGRPIGVTNGWDGTTIITSSYEARAYGVRTGMRVKEAKMLCSDFIQRPSRPKRYIEVSSCIMRSLVLFTPDIEIFSVDEAFLDVTRCQKLLGSPPYIAELVRRKVSDVSGGLLCSVGVSGDKTTAKYAAKLKKPNGLTVIPPWESEKALENVPVTKLCGIAEGIGSFLGQRGVYVCGDMKKLPIGILAKRFGNLGRRIWFMAQGLDPEKVSTNIPTPKSIGHGKVLPPNTKDINIIRIFLLHMSEKVAGRLRKHSFEAQRFFIGFKTNNGWYSAKLYAPFITDDGLNIYHLCLFFLRTNWQGRGVYQVQVTALDPRPAKQQLELFLSNKSKRNSLCKAVDKINQRYGEFSVSPARLIHRSKMPNVIAPAWKPFGHRQSI